MGTTSRELSTAKVEMASCSRKVEGICPGMDTLRTLDLEDPADRTRSANLTQVSTAIGAMESCFKQEPPCRAHYLLKDVFLRLVR